MADNHPKRWDQRRWLKLRMAVLERDFYRCVQCGRAGTLEVDHIVPVHRLQKGFRDFRDERLGQRVHDES